MARTVIYISDATNQAITTKFLYATATKGARIKATCESGSAIVAYDHALSVKDAHKEAFKALVKKLDFQNWGVWECGSLKDGYVFVL